MSQSDYANLFRQVWGAGSLDFVKDVAGTYERIARSIAAYERSPEVSAFSSNNDSYLKGSATLTDPETAGLALFEGKAKCANCHVSRSTDQKPLFTDYSYDNLGVPRNPANPFYFLPPKWNPLGENWIDPGLGGYLKGAGYSSAYYEPSLGKFRVPTLRNVALKPSGDFIKAYGHNGYFKSLEEIVHFYNTRDVEPWPAPEVSINVNRTELGNLGLTAEEEAALVAFLGTLLTATSLDDESDGFTIAGHPAVTFLAPATLGMQGGLALGDGR